MLAQKDECIKDASDTIYQLSREEQIRLQCEAREDYYRRERSNQRRMKELTDALVEKDSIIAALLAENEHLKNNQP